MATENTVPTSDETQNPSDGTATEQGTAAPDATDPAAEPGKESAGAEKSDAEKEVERLKADLAKRDRELKKRDRTQARMHQDIEQLRQRQQPDPGAGGTPDEAAIHSKAQELAREIAQQQRVSESVKAVLAAGKGLENFDAACNTVAQELPFYGGNGQPTAFLSAVLECEKPAQLLHHIGSDPDLLEELTDLTAVRRTLRLGEIARELKEQAKPKASNAPRPLEPLKGGGNGSRPLAALDGDDFNKRRREQIANRRR